MSEEEQILERSRVIDAMLNGYAPREEDGAIAADIAIKYVESCHDHGRARVARTARVTGDTEKRKRLLDVIMQHSFSGEDLRMSLARVSKSVAVIGFPTVDAFTAWCAYRIFPELEKEEYKNGRRRKGKCGRG